jgi:KipI family sensor histidine kinase inhibitor
MDPRVRAFGETALLVEFGDQADLELNARVHALARALEADRPPMLRSLVPGYVSLLVEFDPLQVDLAAMQDWVGTRVHEISATSAAVGRSRTIPTLYGGECGPDLEDVAGRLGLSPSDVVARHTAAELTVYMLGFSPGFPYLGDLPDSLALPRRTTPRERVPVGSVAIAERQTGIYSREMPGGWHVLGRTPVALFDEHRHPPSYLAPGDRVRFVAIAAGDWERYVESPPSDW